MIPNLGADRVGVVVGAWNWAQLAIGKWTTQPSDDPKAVFHRLKHHPQLGTDSTRRRLVRRVDLGGGLEWWNSNFSAG